LKAFGHVISEKKRSRIAKSVEKQFCKVSTANFSIKKATDLIESGINLCFWQNADRN